MKRTSPCVWATREFEHGLPEFLFGVKGCPSEVLTHIPVRLPWIRPTLSTLSINAQFQKVALLLYSSCFLLSRKHSSTLRPSCLLPTRYLQKAWGAVPRAKNLRRLGNISTRAFVQYRATYIPAESATYGTAQPYEVDRPRGNRFDLGLLSFNHRTHPVEGLPRLLASVSPIKALPSPKPLRTCHLVLQVSGHSDQVCICVDHLLICDRAMKVNSSDPSAGDVPCSCDSQLKR